MENKILPVSIVIPTKNEEKNITALMESIKKQIYQPTEVIVSDAGSQDNTIKIARGYGAKVVKGGPISVGRNNGFNASTQNIIVFLDADVQLLGETDLKEIVDIFVEKELDCATCHFAYTGEKSFSKVLSIKAINAAKDISAMSPLPGLKWDWGTVMIITRGAFEEVGGFVVDFKYMEDTLMIQKIVSRGYKYRVINKGIGVAVNERQDRDGRLSSRLREYAAALTGLVSVNLARFHFTQKLGYKLNKVSTRWYGTLGGVVKFQNPFKPHDRVDGFPTGTPNLLRRILEIVPGFFTWLFILFPVIFALLRWNQAFAIYVAFLVAYWLLRSVKFIAGIAIGLRRVKQETSTDWVEKIKKEVGEEAKTIRYIYLCPVYGETLDVLEPSFEAWANSDIGAEKIDVVMAMEEKKSELQLENLKVLKQKYGDRFGSIRYYIHPADIEGEVAGVKGANINWAGRHLVMDLEKEGKDISKYLLISCDSDLRPHPKYLSAVLYKYLTVDERDNRYYASALHTFNNNIWHVPSLIRAQSNMLTLVLLQNWVVDKLKKIPFVGESMYVRDTFSSYIVNLKTLHNLEYWNPEIANDDTAFYWNAMVRTNGTFKSQEVYIPTYNDAVENQTYVKSHVSFYKQQHRWGWGTVNVPITMAALFQKNKEFPVYRKLFMLKSIFEYQIWYLTVVFILAFGLTIMGWLSPSYQYTVLAYNLQKALSYIFTVITLTNIPIVIFRRMITPVPKSWKWWRHILDFAETFLVTVNMLTFGFIPYVQAQTEMMLGQSAFKRNFYVTEKVKMDKRKVVS
jgi:glycosyltransferase involved in cell wall biosynthesis